MKALSRLFLSASGGRVGNGGPMIPNIDPAPCVTAATRAAGQMCISHVGELESRSGRDRGVSCASTVLEFIAIAITVIAR